MTGQLRSVQGCVGVQMGIAVNSHGVGQGQHHKGQGPPCGWGHQREREEFCGLRERCGEKQGGGCARCGPAISLASVGRWTRGWHLQVASLAEVGLGAGGWVWSGATAEPEDGPCATGQVKRPSAGTPLPVSMVQNTHTYKNNTPCTGVGPAARAPSHKCGGPSTRSSCRPPSSSGSWNETCS